MIHARVESVGACSSLGVTWEDTWRALLDGSHCVAALSDVIPECTLRTPVSAVSGLDRIVEQADHPRGAASRLAELAIANALLECPVLGHLAVFGGSTHGESDVLVHVLERSISGQHISRGWWRGLVEDPLAGNCVDGSKTCGAWVYSSCTSSIHALALAACSLGSSSQPEDRALVVGVDAISILGAAGFQRIGAAARFTCRPFAADRDGTVIGEGAAALLLAPFDSSAPSDAVKLLSVGMSCEAGHATRPSDDGKSVADSIHKALLAASLHPNDIVAIVTHGTGTVANDANEVIALQAVFGSASPPATSIKAAIGHTMGAAGVFNCLVAIQACIEGVLPPMTWGGQSLALPGIDIVQHEARKIKTGPILVMCSGFGGNNTAAVFAR